MRALFTSTALCGHFYPLVPLAWTFRALGHDVLVAVADDFVDEVLASGLPSVSCGPPADFAGFTAMGGIDTLAQRRRANGRVFGRNAAANLSGILSIADTWRPDLILSERAETAGPVAAKAFGVPAVELQWGVAPLSEYRSAAAVEFAAPLADLAMAELPPPTVVLNPWPPSLRLRHAIGHHRMRNVPYDGAATVPGWVWRPRTRPRVCLTLGTVLPRLGIDGMSTIVLPMLHALGRLGVEVVVAVEDAIAATWPPLPPFVTHVGRMPLSHVLRTCDVAIHHGGQGTALTALGAGIPQLVLPVFDDQLDNAAAVAAAGAGLSLPTERIEPETVAQHCRELLEADTYRGAATAIATEITVQPSLAGVTDQLVTLAGDRTVAA